MPNARARPTAGRNLPLAGAKARGRFICGRISGGTSDRNSAQIHQRPGIARATERFQVGVRLGRRVQESVQQGQLSNRLDLLCMVQVRGWLPIIRRTGEWTKEDVLERIHKLADNGAELSEINASAYDSSLCGKAAYHFGSWAKAVEAAGVEYTHRAVKWSRSKILEAIRSGRRDKAFQGVVLDYFPSWSDGIREAVVPEEKASRVGNRIRERRRELGLSQGALGVLLGYSHRSIGLLETGRWQDPRVSVALRLAKALKCQVEDILDTEEGHIGVDGGEREGTQRQNGKVRVFHGRKKETSKLRRT